MQYGSAVSALGVMARRRLAFFAPVLFLAVFVAADSHGATVQTFDGGGNTPTLSKTNGTYDPTVATGGPTGSFLRLMINENDRKTYATFDRVETGAANVVVTEFDFKAHSGSNPPADGFGVLLFNTGSNGTTGAATWDNGERPQATNALGIGFRVFDNGAQQSQMIVYYNNNVVRDFTTLPDNYQIYKGAQADNTAFDHCRIVADFNGGTVSVFITPAGGAEFAAVDSLSVPGLSPYEWRLGFGARTGGLNFKLDLDNINARNVNTPAPTITPAGGTFEDSVDVTITPQETGGDAATYYTTDGTEPTPASTFVPNEGLTFAVNTNLKRLTTVRAKTFRTGVDPAQSQRIYTGFNAAVTPPNTVQGLRGRFARTNGALPTTPTSFNFSVQQHRVAPVFAAGDGRINVDNVDGLGNDNIGWQFSGYIEVPTNGIYRFYTASDDGSNLFIDGVKVVDNNFYQGETPRNGDIALKAGKHAFVVDLGQGGGGFGLRVQYGLPATPGNNVTIPDSALSTEEPIQNLAISIPGGGTTFAGATNVSIASPTAGTTIYYTTDGSTPSDTQYTAIYTGAVTITATTTIKAIAYKPNAFTSFVTTQTFTRTDSAPKVVAANALSATSVEVLFDKNVDAAGSNANYAITGDATTRTVTAAFGASNSRVVLTLSAALNNQAYTVNVTGIASGGTPVAAGANARFVFPATGSLVVESYTGLPGTNPDDLTNAPNFPGLPATSQVQAFANFNTPDQNVRDNFGDRLVGLVTIPETGDYRFRCTGDDGTEIYFSANGNPANKTRIARAGGFTGNNFDQEAGQTSAIIALTAGQVCYIEARYKDQGGGEFIRVNWIRPSVPGGEDIPGTQLAPYIETLSFITQPTAKTVVAGNVVTFTTSTTGVGVRTHQWFKDNVAIPGATGATYAFTAYTPDQGMYRVDVTATVDNGANDIVQSISSNSASLAIIDTVAPTLVSAAAVPGLTNKVTLTFSEPVGASATTLSKYTINPDPGITSAVVSGSTVTLTTTTPMLVGLTYTATVTAIDDTGSPANTLATANASFSLVIKPVNGLLAYYKLDDGSETADAADSSGNNRTATVTGDGTGTVTSVTGLFGLADRITADINNPNQRPRIQAPKLPTLRTVSMWVKTSNPAQQGIFDKGGEGNDDRGFTINMTEQDGVGDGNPFNTPPVNTPGLLLTFWGNDVFIPGLALKNNQWHNITVSWDGARSVLIGIDGNLPQGYAHQQAGGNWTALTSQPFTLHRAPNPDNNDVLIGAADDRLWGKGLKSLDGQIDDVRLYNRALSAGEIGALGIPNFAPSTAGGSDATITYGTTLNLSGTATDDNNPTTALTYQWSRTSGPAGGTVNFGTSTALDTTATFSRIGTYVLRLTASDTQYTTADELNVTVTAKSVTVTGNNTSRAYGAANPTLTAAFNGFVNGDTVAVVTGTPVIATTADVNSAAGLYPITVDVSGLSATNYTFMGIAGTLTVTKKQLQVTADNQTRPYGTANAAPTATITGFVNGDTAAVITGTPILSHTAAMGSNIGNYAINVNVSGMSATNYSFTGVAGTLTITPVALTVTANAASRAYGAADPTFTAAYTGFVNGDTATVVSGAPSFSTNATATSTVAGSPYVITPTIGTLSATNYTFTTFNTGVLTITRAVLTVTADGKTKVYGTANPTLTSTTIGFANGETGAVVTGTPVLGTTATASSPIGGYPITVDVSGLTAANYSFNGVAGTLIITRAVLTVEAEDQTRVYGVANAAPTATITGYVNGDTAAVVTGTPALAHTATTASGIGDYAITAAVGSLAAANYSFTFVNGTLTITRAPLTVTANAASRAYGDADPAFTASYTGFVNGDTSAVVSGSPAFSTNATATSTVAGSPYVITPAIGTLSAANYSFTTFNTGALTITAKTLTVTADNKTRPYGNANPTLTATFTGFANGETLAVVTGTPVLNTAATPASNVGTYPITVNVSGLSATNYSFSGANGTLTVTGVALTVTANNATKVYGAANPAFSAVITGFVNGDTVAVVSGSAALSTTATAASGVAGSPYAINAAIGTLAATNYTFTFAPGALTVTKAPLTAKADDKTRNFGAANPTATITYTGFVNGDAAASIDTAPTATFAASADASALPGTTHAITLTGGSDDNYALTLQNGTLTITASAPTIASALTATPNPAAVGGLVTFVVQATSPSAISYTFNFGDGTTAASTTGTATHTFASPQTYTVTVTATAEGLSSDSSVSLAVVSNGSADSDGDGVTDGEEVAIGTNPADPTSKPGGTADADGDGTTDDQDSDNDNDGVTNAQEVVDGTDPFNASSATKVPFTAAKLSGGVNYTKTGADSFSVSGILPTLPAGLNPAQKTVVFSVGGASATFTLDGKGKAKTANGTLQLKFKFKKNKATNTNEFIGGTVPFKVSVKNGTYAAAWADEGVKPAENQSKAPLSFVIDIAFNGKVYTATAPVFITAKTGKGGKFK